MILFVLFLMMYRKCNKGRVASQRVPTSIIVRRSWLSERRMQQCNINATRGLP
jgi:hypothetical protein